MPSLACKELGMTDCPYVASGNDKYEVKGKLLHHEAMQHPDKMNKMDDNGWADNLRTMDEKLAVA